MSGSRTNKEGKQDKYLDKSGNEDGDDSMDDMLNQVISAIAPRGLSGLKVYVSYPFPTQDGKYFKTTFIWDPKFNWILVPKIMTALVGHAARNTTSSMVLSWNASFTQ